MRHCRPLSVLTAFDRADCTLPLISSVTTSGMRAGSASRISLFCTLIILSFVPTLDRRGAPGHEIKIPVGCRNQAPDHSEQVPLPILRAKIQFGGSRGWPVAADTGHGTVAYRIESKICRGMDNVDEADRPHSTGADQAFRLTLTARMPVESCPNKPEIAAPNVPP